MQTCAICSALAKESDAFRGNNPKATALEKAEKSKSPNGRATDIHCGSFSYHKSNCFPVSLPFTYLLDVIITRLKMFLLRSKLRYSKHVPKTHALIKSVRAKRALIKSVRL